MTKRVAVLEPDSQLALLADEVGQRGTEFVVERDGRPVAAVVSLAVYERLQQHRDEAWRRLSAIRERVARELDPDELQSLIDDAFSEVRSGRRG